MDWLTNFIKNNPIFSLFFPTGASAMDFAYNLSMALSDGVITDQEWHQLLAGTSGLSTFALTMIMFALKKSK